MSSLASTYATVIPTTASIKDAGGDTKPSSEDSGM